MLRMSPCGKCFWFCGSGVLWGLPAASGGWRHRQTMAAQSPPLMNRAAKAQETMAATAEAVKIRPVMMTVPPYVKTVKEAPDGGSQHEEESTAIT